MERLGEVRIIETLGAHSKIEVDRHRDVIIQYETNYIPLSKSELVESNPLRTRCTQAHALTITTGLPALESFAAAGDVSPRDTFHSGRSQTKLHFPWMPHFEVL
jgi:hypothetical protein